MSKTVRKSLKDIKAELSQSDIDRELLRVKETPEHESLSEEVLEKFVPVGDRFKNLVGREPRSQKVTIRFESAVLSFLKQDAARLGKPYQTHINDILRTYVATSPEIEAGADPATKSNEIRRIKF